MNKQELAECLQHEIDHWALKTYEQLQGELSEPVSYEGERNGKKYVIEAQILENTPEYVHVSMDAEDGSALRTFLPLSRSFLVYRDGNIDV